MHYEIQADNIASRATKDRKTSECRFSNSTKVKKTRNLPVWENDKFASILRMLMSYDFTILSTWM